MTSLLTRSVLCVAALSMAACAPRDAGIEQESRDTGSGQDAVGVEDRLRAMYGELGGELRYFDAVTDLDGDGRAEIVVYAYGPMLCGTGGCNTLVFAPEPPGYRLVTSISVSRPPIRVASRSTNGWRNLLVHVSGGGIVEGYDAELEFDGTTYPSNPTVPPAEPASDTEGAEVLIPEFESFAEGKLVPPRQADTDAAARAR